MVSRRSYKIYFLICLIIIFLFFINSVNERAFSDSELNHTLSEREWENPKLSNNYEISEFIEIKNRDIPYDAERGYSSGIYTKEQKSKIMKSSESAVQDLRTYDKHGSEDDLLDSLRDTIKVVGYEELYPFINCANDVENVSSKYYRFIFYLSEFDSNRIDKILSKRNHAISTLGYFEDYIENRDKIIDRAKKADNILNDLDIYELKCNQFHKYLERDYKRQRLWIIFKSLMFILGIVVISITLRILSANAMEGVRRLSNKFMVIVRGVLNPKEISSQTIEFILKADSILSTFTILIGFFISLKGIGFILAMIAFVTVLFLLISLLLGVISMSNNDLDWKKYSYLFFVMGMMFFVATIIYVSIIAILFGSIDTIGESIKYYLSNQTEIK